MKRYLLIIAGSICLVLGAIGAFIPIFPTTPFVLLAAFCFMKGSPALYHRILKIPWLGGFIRQYTESDTLSMRARIEAIAILWIGLVISMVVVGNQTMIWVLILIGIAVTIHLLTIKRKVRS